MTESGPGTGAGGPRTPRNAHSASGNPPNSTAGQRRGSLPRQISRRLLTHPSQRPALLNDQPRAQFKVDDGTSRTDFSTPFKVATTSQKYSVEIKAEEVRASAGKGLGSHAP